MKELKEFVKIFPHQIFGDLTIIKSRVEDDTYWFVGKEIQEILGFQDLSQAISKADLDVDEVLILNKKENKKIFDDFVKNYNEVSLLKREGSKTPLISKHTATITLIKESGLYGVGMASRKPIGKDFRRAIRKDILPGVRKLFEKIEKIQLRHDIIMHLDFEYQKFNSKCFNGMKFAEGGRYNVIFNNKEISERYTDKPPSYWKRKGKEKAVELGIPESKIASGLDGLRLLKPEESCCISQHKEYMRFGLTDEKAFALSSAEVTKGHFKLMIDNGVIPNEFNKYLNEKKK